MATDPKVAAELAKRGYKEVNGKWIKPEAKKHDTTKPSVAGIPTGGDPDAKGRYLGREGEKTPMGLNPRSPYKTDQELVDAYKKMGIDYSALSDKDAQAALYDKADPFQKAYMWGSIGNTKKGLGAKQDPKFDKWKPLPGEGISAYKERLSKSGYTPESLNKDLAPYKESFADSYRGLREAALLNPLEEQVAQKTAEKPAAGIETAAGIPPIIPMGPGAVQGNAPWWLQDEINVAADAANFFKVKKYSPWQATPDVTLPDPTFFDPTRQLAANAEMANIGTQGLAAFTNPQAFASGYSAIQGQGAKGAADILGQYDNMNVGVANDFATRRTDIMNQNAANKAGLATQLADKYAILNQQFDNAKGQRMDIMRNDFVNAITNKQNTGNLNDLYDQYKIDPSVGGRIKWTHGKPIKPEEAPDNWVHISKFANRLIQSGVKPEQAFKMAFEQSGGKQSSQGIYDPSSMVGYQGVNETKGQ